MLHHADNNPGVVAMYRPQPVSEDRNSSHPESGNVNVKVEEVEVAHLEGGYGIQRNWDM